MTNKAHSEKGVPFEVLMNKSVRENLLVAAEACFEQNPCPRIEKWCDDLKSPTKEEPTCADPRQPLSPIT